MMYQRNAADITLVLLNLIYRITSDRREGDMSRYNVKRIITNNYEEVYIKSATDKIPNKRSKKAVKENKPKRSFDEMNTLEQVASIRNKQKYYKNKRFDIARLIDVNMDKDTKFITLTFRDTDDFDITNYEDSKIEFDKFMKRLRRYLSQYTVRYIAVHEIQKNRNAYHFHMVVFGMPYISNTKLNEIWGLGFVKINKVPNTVQSSSTGIYISKYFTKEENDIRYRNKYYTSRNLVKPEVKYELVRSDELEKYIQNENTENFEQFKEYKYNRPAYGINKGTEVEEVKVTYIRKKI